MLLANVLDKTRGFTYTLLLSLQTRGELWLLTTKLRLPAWHPHCTLEGYVRYLVSVRGSSHAAKASIQASSQSSPLS